MENQFEINPEDNQRVKIIKILIENPELMHLLSDPNYIGNILEQPDYEKEYLCSRFTKSRGFKLMHKLVLLTKKHPILNNIIKLYYEKYPNEINDVNKENWSPLMLASRNSGICSSEETVKILIDTNANLNLTNNELHSSLSMAASHSGSQSTIGTVKMLIESGADINLYRPDKWSPLMFSCAYINSIGSTDAIKMLIEAKANINEQNAKGETSLMHAAKNNEEAVKLLIDAKADLKIKNDNGYTALAVAAMNIKETNNENIIRMLVLAEQQQ